MLKVLVLILFFVSCKSSVKKVYVTDTIIFFKEMQGKPVYKGEARFKYHKR